MFLEEEGCYAYQGFLFSPALTAPQFDSFVARRPSGDQVVNVGHLSRHRASSLVEDEAALSAF
jgi:hypothetical protein